MSAEPTREQIDAVLAEYGTGEEGSYTDHWQAVQQMAEDIVRLRKESEDCRALILRIMAAMNEGRALSARILSNEIPDEIARIRSLAAPDARAGVTEDASVRVLHDDAMKACDEKRWADALVWEALALSRATKVGTSAHTRRVLAGSVTGICAALVAALEVGDG